MPLITTLLVNIIKKVNKQGLNSIKLKKYIFYWEAHRGILFYSVAAEHHFTSAWQITVNIETFVLEETSPFLASLKTETK